MRRNQARFQPLALIGKTGPFIRREANAREASAHRARDRVGRRARARRGIGARSAQTHRRTTKADCAPERSHRGTTRRTRRPCPPKRSPLRRYGASAQSHPRGTTDAAVRKRALAMQASNLSVYGARSENDASARAASSRASGNASIEWKCKTAPKSRRASREAAHAAHVAKALRPEPKPNSQIEKERRPAQPSGRPQPARKTARVFSSPPARENRCRPKSSARGASVSSQARFGLGGRRRVITLLDRDQKKRAALSDGPFHS